MSLIDLIFPRECLSCGKPGSHLCFECKKKLTPHPELCPFCHSPQRDFKTCQLCKYNWETALEWVLICFSYQTLIKKLILKLKFYHKKDIWPFLAQRLRLLTQTHQTLSEALNRGNLIISFIPSHRWRHYFEKGYNQSELLAKHLAKELNIPVLQLAKKGKYTASQLKLSRSQRQKNLNSAFSPLHLEKIPKDSHILLVDDVTTTASTLKEVATCIKSSRPDLKIRWGVLARHTW